MEIAEDSKVEFTIGFSTIGDNLMATTAIRDLKKAYPKLKIRVKTPLMEVWENNPYIDQFDKPDHVIPIGLKKITNTSRTSELHFTSGYRISIDQNLNITIPQGISRPEIYLSEVEKRNKIIEGKYWVVCLDHGPNMTSKQWMPERWQEVVDRHPWITFVQVGVPGRNTYKLTGENVINFMGQTPKIRDLFKVIYHAEGALTLISGPMHIAAAFNKPCVVIAGAREPVKFISYPNNRFLHHTGCLPCCDDLSCWSNFKDGCFFNTYQKVPEYKKKLMLGEKNYNEFGTDVGRNGRVQKWAQKNAVNWTPDCMRMITVGQVLDAINSYYHGGVLRADKVGVKIKKQKTLKIVAKCIALGGAERSVIEIANLALQKGYKVQIVPRHGDKIKAFSDLVPGVEWTSDITDYADYFLFYASDMIWDFNKPEFDVLKKINAGVKTMALTFKIGRTGKDEWTRQFDNYMFLCSSLENDFKKVMPEANTIVLPPATTLDPFLKNQPNYNDPIRIVRHSSQGDNKYSTDIVDIVFRHPEIEFLFMPAPSYMPNNLPNVIKYKMNELSVPEFLSKGNCFWYLLPEGYTDQGPKVIVEAMAAGLAIIGENRDGAADRIDRNIGWKINDHSEIDHIFSLLNSKVLKTKGIEARKKALKFDKSKWLNHITGE